MGRSKKNWDHLVDVYGNYGINITEGIYPGSGLTPGIKGKKGEQGNKGEEGNGDKGQKGDKGQVGSKGIKGEIGPGGLKGSKGDTAQIFEFQGTVGDLSGLPGDAEMGHIYFVLSEDNAYFWDGADWVLIPNINAITGDKGEQGDVGIKGEPGANGLDGIGGAEGDKGDKGEPGTDFDPLDYYDRDSIEAFLEHLHSPEFAFDVAYYQDPTSNVENETIDFLSSDAQDELYNPGMVVINTSCTVTNSPVAASRLLVVNYVIDNPGRLRGNGYGMLQYVYSADVATTADDGFYRRVRPAQSQFGPWRKVHFDSENYYDKDEVNERNTDYRITLQNEFSPNRSSIALQDRNGNGKTSKVEIEGRGGIHLTNIAGKLIIDGSPLSGQLTLIGMVPNYTDPTEYRPDPDPGDYLIFKYSGYNPYLEQDVKGGDWVIWSASPEQWNYLDMSVNYGVAEVRTVEDGYILDQGGIQFPLLSLDQEAFDSDYPTSRTVAGQATYSHLANNDDVVIDMRGNGQSLTYNDQRDADDPLIEPGTYYVDLGANQISFCNRDANLVTAGSWFGDTVNDTDPSPKHKLMDPNGEWSVTGLVASGGDANNQYTIVYKDGNAPAAAKQYGNFYIVHFDEYDLNEGDVLTYNSNIKKWTPSQPITSEILVQHLESTTPVGSVVHWFGQVVPDGWLRCDATDFDIAVFPKLHSYLETNFHNYRIGVTPDLRNKFLRSANSTNMTEHVYGKDFGHKTARPYDFTAAIKGAGGHSHTGTTESEGTHFHPYEIYVGAGAGTGSGQNILRPPGSGAGNGGTKTFNTESAGAHQHGFTTESEPDHQHGIVIVGWDSETTPKYVECSFIIKTDYIF